MAAKPARHLCAAKAPLLLRLRWAEVRFHGKMPAGERAELKAHLA